jgi:glycosyltransferase involved in cell wall biosynthesis
MKILHLVESLERGGLERVVVNLALAQHAAGNAVVVVCLFREGALAHELSSAGVRVSCAQKSASLDWRAVRHVRQELAALHADVLHTHNAMANYYGVLAALGTRVRVVNTRHGMGSASANALTERLFRVSLLRTAAVAAVCEHARRHFVGVGTVPARLVHVVYNGIRVEDFVTASPAARTAARATLGVPADAYLVGTVGRLNWAKDHALLLDAFAALRQHMPQSRLVLIGEGSLRSDLEARALGAGVSPQVTFAGDRGDVPSLLPAFDVFALTSATEGYSIALLEAAAAALPVVATDVGGNREIVQDGSTGIVVRDRTAAEFARALADLGASSERRAELGRNARKWAEAFGSVAAMAASYSALYSASARSAVIGRVTA